MIMLEYSVYLAMMVVLFVTLLATLFLIAFIAIEWKERREYHRPLCHHLEASESQE